jgi:hypothetical protein
VVGTSVATQRIRTGDRIRVDGGAGVVTVVERAAVGGTSAAAHAGAGTDAADPAPAGRLD